MPIKGARRKPTVRNPKISKQPVEKILIDKNLRMSMQSAESLLKQGYKVKDLLDPTHGGFTLEEVTVGLTKLMKNKKR